VDTLRDQLCFDDLYSPRLPSVSDKLAQLRLKIFSFADQYKAAQPKPVKVHKKDKESKKEKKKRLRENPEESRVSYDEQHDLSLLLAAFQLERKQNAPPEYVPVKAKPKGPHHGGPFITGDFCTETGIAKSATLTVKELARDPSILREPSII
jgi:hypothetical protein